jgi:UDP-N-acetylglucosamine 2-epimerase (non-hydrolysing)
MLEKIVPTDREEYDRTSQSFGMVASVVGTRPEIIKLAPVVKACIKTNIRNEIVHTGQHYSYELDSLIFEDVGLLRPSHNLGIGSGTHAEETAKALVGLEALFKKLKPSLVLVQGDTNSALAGALAASKLHIPVGHVEAGLRSFDRRMPEEKNRVLTDHLSDLLFAPTRTSYRNLTSEGIPSERISLTGNTIVDAVKMGLHLAETRAKEKGATYALPDEDFLLLTLHREENVDDLETLRKIVQGVSRVSWNLGKKTVFPAHPRTIGKLKQFGIDVPDSVRLIPPVGFLDFLTLERNADLILTDSGGVQEEACILQVPCLTLRENTERPETIEIGANYLAGLEPDRIVQGADIMINKSRDWNNPFGDGNAGAKIVEIIVEKNWSFSS